ncbi:hypothetical protein Btru_073852 [Bulinus truncatus]|nr:hypothetical protein Btru_073852 [Bulinus truncatus]
MSQDMELYDCGKKKKYIENTLVPALDASIVKLAKSRKRHPQKCRNKVREIANNMIQYYSKVCVKNDQSLKEQLSSQPSLTFSETWDIPDNLNTISKEITECLAARRELRQAYKVCIKNYETDSKNYSRLKKECLSFLPLYPFKTSCFDAHYLKNPDFVVDESVKS